MSLKGKCPLTQGPHGALVRKHKICDFIVEESDRLPRTGIYVESRTIRAALGNKKGSLASAMCGVVVLLSKM
ncbi:hypothetical protein N7455_004265 [Penicillium solitum]|uniref:uncharacterized protein n=1 Tax=Penicillium solitum TaxID=60172 RepID=UPI0032C48159|nr:hypothetical protein N7455_004265 [Penicillium solitum]